MRGVSISVSRSVVTLPRWVTNKLRRALAPTSTDTGTDTGTGTDTDTGYDNYDYEWRGRIDVDVDSNKATETTWYTRKQLLRATQDLFNQLNQREWDTRDRDRGEGGNGNGVDVAKRGWKYAFEGKAKTKAAAHVLLRSAGEYAATVHAITKGLSRMETKRVIPNRNNDTGGIHVDEHDEHEHDRDRDLNQEGEEGTGSVGSSGGTSEGRQVNVSVLDYGAGCASASLALMEVLPKLAEEEQAATAREEGEEDEEEEEDTRARQRFAINFLVDGVEGSRALSRLGRQVLPEAFWYKSLKGWHARQKKKSWKKSKYDVALAAFALSELEEEEDVLEELGKIWTSIKPGGVFVCIESGNPGGAEIMSRVRDWILKQPQGKGEGGRILAPCTHQHACPMAAALPGREGKRGKEWCHFVQSYTKTEDLERWNLTPAAHWTNYKQARSHGMLRKPEPKGRSLFEKFSYLTVAKSSLEGTGEGNVVSVMPLLFPGVLGEEGSEEDDGLGSDSYRRYRIVATPKKRGKHAIFRVCGEKSVEDEEAAISQTVLTSRRHRHTRWAFKRRWGDLLDSRVIGGLAAGE